MGLKVNQPLEQKKTIGRVVLSNYENVTNLAQKNEVFFSNGMRVTYPTQDLNKNASITLLPAQNGDEDSRLVLKNIEGASVFTTRESDFIMLEGCTNCVVDSSTPDGKRDYIHIKDSESYASKNNTVYLSDDHGGDGVDCDFTCITHNNDKHLKGYEKYYRGYEGAKTSGEPGFITYKKGISTVQEGELMDAPKTLWQGICNAIKYW